MRRTRLSLAYVAGYLLGGGAGLALAPGGTLGLLGSNTTYDDVMPRALGIVQLAFGLVVAQILRHRAEDLVATVAIAGGLMAACWLAVFVASGDPLFLVGAGVAAAGVVFNVAALRADRRPGPFARLGRQRDSMEMR